jgi:hypothetical protein
MSIFGPGGGGNAGIVTDFSSTIGRYIYAHSIKPGGHTSQTIRVSELSDNVFPEDASLDTILRACGTGLLRGCAITRPVGSGLEISSGLAILKTTNSEDCSFALCAIDAAELPVQSLAINQINYIVAEWNSAGGAVSCTTDNAVINGLNKIEIGRVTVDSYGAVTIISSGYTLASNPMAELDARLKEINYVERGHGLIVSGTHDLLPPFLTPMEYEVTAGSVYHGLNRYVVSAKALNAPFDAYYYDTATETWLAADSNDANHVVHPTLSLVDGQYFVHWLYICHAAGETGGIFRHVMLLSQAVYTSLAEAEAVAVPTNLPDFFPNVGALLIGRVIISYRAPVPSDDITATFQSAFVHPVWNGQMASSHTDLAGVQGGEPGQYYHLTQYDHEVVTTMFSAKTSSGGMLLGNCGTKLGTIGIANAGLDVYSAAPPNGVVVASISKAGTVAAKTVQTEALAMASGKTSITSDSLLMNSDQKITYAGSVSASADQELPTWKQAKDYANTAIAGQDKSAFLPRARLCRAPVDASGNKNWNGTNIVEVGYVWAQKGKLLVGYTANLFVKDGSGAKLFLATTSGQTPSIIPNTTTLVYNTASVAAPCSSSCFTIVDIENESGENIFLLASPLSDFGTTKMLSFADGVTSTVWWQPVNSVNSSMT